MNDLTEPQARPVSTIVDTDLRNSHGDLIGVVHELLVDLDSGRILYVLATGVRGQRLQFPWSAIRLEEGAFVLRRPGAHLLLGRRD